MVIRHAALREISVCREHQANDPATYTLIAGTDEYALFDGRPLPSRAGLIRCVLAHERAERENDDYRSAILANLHAGFEAARRERAIVACEAGRDEQRTRSANARRLLDARRSSATHASA
jgi:hypothetical protein